MVIALFSAVAAVGCQKQYRRGEEEETSEQPGSGVEAKSDPRFPHAADTSGRRGFWVEQPVRTGPVSPTGLANAVAEALPGLRERCCGEGDGKCERFEGRVLVEAEVRPDGSVAQVGIGETSIYDREFRRCLLEWAGDWELPAGEMEASETVYVPIRARFVGAEDRDGGDAVPP